MYLKFNGVTQLCRIYDFSTKFLLQMMQVYYYYNLATNYDSKNREFLPQLSDVLVGGGGLKPSHVCESAKKLVMLQEF